VTDIIIEPAAKKTEEPAEELPEVDEATVGQLSEEVWSIPLQSGIRVAGTRTNQFLEDSEGIRRQAEGRR
jgi:hypothetical protein